MSNLFIFVVLILSSCIRPLIAIDTQCGNKVVNTIVVDQTGLGNFRAVQSAIDSVTEGNSQWIKIKVNRGFYFEKVTIPLMKPCILLEGEGQRVTTISYNAHQATDVSGTFISHPSNVVVRNITFENTYYNRVNFRVTSNDFAIKPAVAVSVYGDKSAFYNCDFLGLQDTLWDNTGRHYFKNCYIEGAMDFIFGNGQSIYEDCNIKATAGAHSAEVKFGYITAQARAEKTERSGFVFIRGSVSGTTPVFLGRAYGPYSRVIFINTQFSSVIIPQGWNSWKFPGHESKFTYAEVDCSGAGSDMSRRVPWIEKLTRFSTKIRFSTSSFIDQDDWLSKTPF